MAHRKYEHRVLKLHNSKPCWEWDDSELSDLGGSEGWYVVGIIVQRKFFVTILLEREINGED